MTKWKLVPVGVVTPEMTTAFAKVFNVKLQRETFMPAVSAMLEAAPPPPALTDERIKELSDMYMNMYGFDDVAFVRAIEREILGGGE